MPISRKTYLDLPKDLRREKAAQAAGRLRLQASNPHVSPEQKEKLLKQVGVVAKWAAGVLPTEIEGVNDYVLISEAMDAAQKK
jgi:hypothetical protein